MVEHLGKIKARALIGVRAVFDFPRARNRMSENAIRTVQAQGPRFFGPRPGMELDRWARNDLREAFRTAGRDPRTSAACWMWRRACSTGGFQARGRFPQTRNC
jgi:hypothetical protein